MVIGIQTKLLINNEWVDSVSGKTFAAVNPADESILAHVQEADKEDVDIAVKAARAALTGPWGQLTGRQRRDIMLKFADLIEQNSEELATFESHDNGKPKSIALAVDLPMTVRCYRYYAGWADGKITGKTIPIEGPFFCYTRSEPVGVVGQIIPWNFPLLMQAWKLGPALAAGCTIVMKSSEKTPLTALMIGKLIVEAGFPPGVVNLLSGFGPTCGQAIARHMDINKVAFTGSSGVGHKIMLYAAESNLKRVSLELGGKSPLLIFDDADLDKAVATAKLGLFFNGGQCCVASSRVFVQETIYDKFVAKCVEESEKQKVLHPSDPACEQGPVVDDLQFKRVMGFIDKGKAEGARLMCGGERLGDRGFFIKPTVFADVEDDMTIAKEEIFGPVMSIIKFKTEAEIVDRANGTTFGLAGGVVTRDVSRAIRIAAAIKAGTIWVNCYNVFDCACPFGGFKQSGLGRELGEEGLHEYLEIKNVIVAIEPAPTA
jgi:aldehyde dehydrogenase (NAD+)